VLEAMAVGTPVVVTPEVGAAEIVRSAGAGIVSGATPAELGNALSVMINDAAQRQRMADSAKVTARSFEWSHVAEQMERVYDSIACGR
jgi:phosphatidyl-myo-inositol alpha-mannosyltransferase